MLNAQAYNTTALLKRAVLRVRNMGLYMRSGIASYRLTGRFFPFSVRLLDRRIRFVCSRHRNSRVIVRGVISLTSWLGNSAPVVIKLEEGSELRVEGDLLLGPNVRMSVGKDAKLIFGGKDRESESGITENAIILTAKSIEIGKDFLGAWGLFITDADHHPYGENNPPLPVTIGDHVWMCPGSSVLKGACVGSDSVITAKSLVLKGDYSDGSLIGGIPARKIGNAKVWHR